MISVLVCLFVCTGTSEAQAELDMQIDARGHSVKQIEAGCHCAGVLSNIVPALMLSGNLSSGRKDVVLTQVLLPARKEFTAT